MTNNTTAALTDEQRAAINMAISVLTPLAMDEYGDALRALLTSPRAAVPDGGKLVPIEPTQEMLDCWWDGLPKGTAFVNCTPCGVYGAMLDAAPAAPVVVLSDDDAANLITIDRRDLYGFVRGSIKRALEDASHGAAESHEPMSAVDCWSEAHTRTIEIFDSMKIAGIGEVQSDAQDVAADGADTDEISGKCFIVIGHGESDIPEAKIIARREDLLDAVLGMIYTHASEAPDDVRAEYAESLSDDDEWAADRWSVDFEIGGIVIWRVGLHPVSLRAAVSPATAVTTDYAAIEREHFGDPDKRTGIYAPATAESKCTRCGSSTAQACNERGCFYLESGEGEPATADERHEDGLLTTEALISIIERHFDHDHPDGQRLVEMAQDVAASQHKQGEPATADERAAFEKVFPVPPGLQFAGGAYSSVVLHHDEDEYRKHDRIFVQYNGAWLGWKACASQAAAPAEAREPSPTAGMNLGERIKHVGGRENAAGYIEFGSVAAVGALIKQVIRDLPRSAPADAGEAVATVSISKPGDSLTGVSFMSLTEHGRQTLGKGKHLLYVAPPDGAGDAGAPSADLIARCRELLELSDLGESDQTALRALADTYRRDISRQDRLVVAKSQTHREAMQLVLDVARAQGAQGGKGGEA
ncbi:hypothetical protein [Burkholderia glumae]|uniref:hypothetical protein n=1 Tax=Burkholderia glumae TaxID=337 RepID=UPI0021509864|nr:hypothetical protein [Burkholderia glumae]